MRRLRANGGLSLAETIVAGTLALVLGLLMLRLLISGLGAHNKGSESRDAQSGVRTLVGLLVAELRSSNPPPMADPLVVTPVFWPGVWGADQEASVSEPFYTRAETQEPDGTTERDSSTNRVLYVRARAEAESESGEGPLAPYLLVELYVPRETPWLVVRRVHPLTGLDTLLHTEEVEGADGARRQGWLLDMAALEAMEAPESPDVVFDAGPDSRVAFRVSHVTFEPASDPGRTRYPQLFEPGVFRVEVAVAVRALSESAAQQAWPRKQDWSTMREEATELRIPSVRQS